MPDTDINSQVDTSHFTSTQDSKSRNFFSRLSVASKLVGGLSVLAVLGAVTGAAGLLSMSGVAGKLAQITDTAVPTVINADALEANIWESTKIAEEIVAEERREQLADLQAEITALNDQFDVTYAQLDEIVVDESLADELKVVSNAHKAFADISAQISVAHNEALAYEEKAKDLTVEFDGLGEDLIVALDEFATENEIEMAQLEEAGDQLLLRGASAAAINNLLGDLFETDYPSVEAALKLERLVFETRDLTKRFLLVEVPENTGEIRTEFDALVARAGPHLETLKRLAESDEDKADFDSLLSHFNEWVLFATEPDKLLDSHMDMLIAQRNVHGLIERLENEADRVSATLHVVSETARAMSRAADMDAASAVTTGQLIILALFLAVLVTSIALIYFVLQSTIRPINDMTDVMAKLSDGDHTVDVPHTDRIDEVGAMANAVEVFKHFLRENVDLSSRQEEEARQRKRAERITSLIASFEEASGELLTAVNSAAGHLNQNSTTLTMNAQQVKEQSMAVAAGSEEAAVNVQTVAAASEELSSSIVEVTRQIDDSSQIATTAMDEAGVTMTTMQSLGEASQKIGDVVGLITDIAEQTNLLALNATIEAARAGEAGKGFAIVASEVKTLANQTAKATEEIGKQIGGIQSISTDAALAIEKMANTISNMNDIASAVSQSINQQEAATREISRNVNEASNGTSEVSRNIADVSRIAQETETAAGEVAAAATDVGQHSEALSTHVREFLEGIRDAG